jgi:hypothetical protein
LMPRSVNSSAIARRGWPRIGSGFVRISQRAVPQDALSCHFRHRFGDRLGDRLGRAANYC